jgi:hypothetical protein
MMDNYIICLLRGEEERSKVSDIVSFIVLLPKTERFLLPQFPPAHFQHWSVCLHIVNNYSLFRSTPTLLHGGDAFLDTHIVVTKGSKR